MNKNAVEVCNIIQQWGYKSYLVGGCVRDLQLKQTPKDWDIATNASPDVIQSIFDKTYPTGLKHGTITVSLNGEHFEVTTFRTEGKYSDGRRPDSVSFVDNIEEDLSRRDFTINAMAFDPIKNELIDPFGGETDLKNEYLRCVGDPNERFQEDGLRIMRAARFASRFGFVIETKTFDAMANSGNLMVLSKVSKERMNDELSKILMGSNMSYGIKILFDTGAMSMVSPLLVPHEVRLCKGDLKTRLAHLYRDYDPKDVIEELKMLKFSNKEIKRVRFILELKSKYEELIKRGGKKEYRHFIAHIKNNSLDSFEYTYEQFLHWVNANRGYGKNHDIIFTILKEIDISSIISRKELEINGNDLISIGIIDGKKIKSALDYCYELVLNNKEVNNKNKLIEKMKNINYL